MRVMVIVKATESTENCFPPEAIPAMHAYNASAIAAARYPRPPRHFAITRPR
jgi:hypothetical protein